jgi:hypothetical protein
MLALNVIGGLLVGNGLSGLWILALGVGHPLFGANISGLEVVVGGLILLVRAFQLGRDSR